MIASLQASGDWKTSMSELSYGDLVFPSSGHVGIYIGDGMMIHAPHPGANVKIASVYSFIGGGTY
jgi:cell wall-associated NlpC family hydrolase